MSKLIKIDPDKGKTTETHDEVEPQIGEWYWVKETVGSEWDAKRRNMSVGDTYEWFGCVMHIGSNYIELHTPHSRDEGNSPTRVHFDEFWTRLRKEADPGTVIHHRIAHYQGESNRLIEEVKRVSASLGLNPKGFLTGPAEPADEHTTALATISGTANVKEYEKALVEAKEKTLPELFGKIKKANSELCRWMTATTMETQALMGPMQGTIKEIEGRIFNVSLYAGLTEDVKQVADGEPADMMDKLHVMQRRLYMDEEALLNYEAGGMEFKDIEAYDAWLARPENRDRILPFPRTLVAFRVRRNMKEREWDGSLSGAINIQCQQNADKTTFFYIRNGEQLYRMDCEMAFPEMIFPDKNLYDPGTAMMVKSRCGGRSNSMITVHEYEERCKAEKERELNHEKWQKENPGVHHFHSPFDNSPFCPSEWAPFDPSNVYFDDCMAEIEKEIKEYNRIAIIIQGLFDRSLVLHPHPPVRTWEPGGFERAIKLVFDGAATLYHGDPPDFEAYRAEVNEFMGAFSVVTGQEDYWEEREAEKYNERANYRNRNHYDVQRYRPYGNPGPGRVAMFFKWNAKQRTGTFRWLRENVGWRGSQNSHTPCTLTVPADQLFNISGYTPGDYKQFFNDPRTREQYLKWAPMLLTAEDYHAGKIKVQEPVTEEQFTKPRKARRWKL